jgi:hypothetical protein
MPLEGRLVRRIVKLSILSLLLSSGALAADSGTPNVYRWTDDKGVVHYGDSVPPEYAQRERSVLNRQGVEVQHVAGSGNESADQLKADVAAREQAQHDQFLLTTYGSVKDIETLRDERLDQLDGQVRASTLYIDSIDSRMLELELRAANFKPYSSDAHARRMPDELAVELVRTFKESRSQRGTLASKRREEDDMRVQFDSDIARYRELTAHRPPS